MIVKPSDFATKLFRLNGAPLRLPYESMRHIYPIYNRPSRAIILKFARQTHKSTTVGYKIALPTLRYQNYHSLYVAPTGNQVSVFSTDKLDGTLRGSEIIQENFINTHTKDQVSYKEFTNGSKIYLRSAFHTADSIRGISSDSVTIDEVQDIISDHIPVIEQCMSHSIAKHELMLPSYPDLPGHLFNNRIYAGTPKTIENTMEGFWAQSTQNEWIIRCQHQGCKKYNYINEYNIGDTCLICNKCGKPIYYRDGQWIAMNKSGFIDGYRLPQIVVNWVNNERNLDAWKVNVINTRKIYSTEKYFNEVLALPYANAKHPLNIVEIKACCNDKPMLTEHDTAFHEQIKGHRTYAGIDWGKGDTASGTSYSVLTIAADIKHQFTVVFVKKYVGKMSDPLLQIADMLKIIFAYECSLVIADTGDGRVSNAMMVEKLGPTRFAEIYEHGTIRKKINWDGQKGHYIMNRTRIMTDVMMEIKRTLVRFFRFAEFEQYSPDFTGIYAEYSEQTRMTKYDHVVPDDCFHSYMFSRIARSIITGEYGKYLSSSSDFDDNSGQQAITVV